MANIRELNGLIFNSKCQTIVNAVNCVGVMGRGIALEFKYRYPEMFDSYEKLCDQKKLKPGLLYLWTKSDPWILNFPTKNHWKFPSKIEYIEAGLIKFTETYTEKGIKSIAFPQLGSSLGGLDWIIVRSLMYKYLEPLERLDVEIYSYDRNAKDNWYQVLLRNTRNFEISAYADQLRLDSKQARILYTSMQSNRIQNMIDIQSLEGLGQKSLEKIYSFVRAKHLEETSQPLNDSKQEQLTLF